MHEIIPKQAQLKGHDRYGTSEDEGPITILLVEDDLGDAVLVERILRNEHLTQHRLIHVFDMESFLEKAQTCSPDVVLLDLNLARSRGLETLRTARSAFPELPIVIMTGLSDNAMAIAAVREGAQDFCIKGTAGGDAMMRIMRYAIERKHAEEQRQQLESQVQEAQKLESLSVLASGIAHDFNNLLLSILGNADLALMELAPEAPARQRIQNMIHAAGQAADLAKQMLAYSGRGSFMLEHLDLHVLVEETLHLIEVSISKNIQLRCDYGTGLPTIEADATQLRQILLNLVINASEAIGDQEGEIQVRTGFLEKGNEGLQGCFSSGEPGNGPHCYFEVSDTGCGISAEDAKKAFDPFYTTKFTGRGLGLAAVLGIVRGHKATIQIWSEPEQGTLFRVLFPASEVAPPSTDVPATTCQQESLEGASVLFVDDEESVRAVVGDMLRKLGMQVTLAKDGREALATFAQDTQRFEHIILDLTMPVMNGEATFLAMRDLRADVHVLLASGYHEEDLCSRFGGQGIAGFIQKPFRTKTLGAALLLAKNCPLA